MSELLSGRYETLAIETTERVATIFMNRPRQLNAINLTMLEELADVLSVISQDDRIRVSVLRGRGRAFSAGFDISRGGRAVSTVDGQATVEPSVDHDSLDQRMRYLLQLWEHPKPMIAAVHGECRAIATVVAIMCDITVVAEETRIALSSVPLGAGLVESLWTFLVGPKQAKLLSFNTGSVISGKQAADWGWANYAVPESALDDNVAELARSISRNPSSVLRLKKSTINGISERMGFRQVALEGAVIDALAHQTGAVRNIRSVLDEFGIQETRRRFEAGEIEF